jgi:hypothetical protein
MSIAIVFITAPCTGRFARVRVAVETDVASRDVFRA